MSQQNAEPRRWPALGMASLVLGHIALLLFFLPVLGVQIAAVALLLGLLGTVLVPLTGGTSLRWSLAGLAISCLALAVNLAIYYAPSERLPGTREPEVTPRYAGAPPPPARPVRRPVAEDLTP